MPHLNRAVNDPLLAGSEYKPYSYQNPVVGEEDLAKPLDINQLDFSLDDFQKLSKGTYNAGEFRITDSGKLDIVNNHKTWTIFNHKSVDGADSYAIRVAFAKAMAAGGLGKDAMKAVRKALGLGAGYTVGTSKALKPLTRQEVRQLIDANIATLNKGRAPGDRLKTYDQLHARYSAEEKRDIAAAREEINRTGSAGAELNTELLDVLAVANKNPSFKGLSVADAEYYLEFIDELSTALECLLDKDARYDWVRENHTEYKVSVTGGPTGMAIALSGGDVIFETVTDGKRSRINLGLSPAELQDRLDQAQAQLNEIAVLDVDESANAGKADPGGDASQKVRSKKAESPAIPLDDRNSDDSVLIENDDLSIGTKPKIQQFQAPRQDASFHEAHEIDDDDDDPEADMKTAMANLNTLARVVAQQYDLDRGVVEGILKQVEGWEGQLAECETDPNVTRMVDLNNDLKNFLVGNQAFLQPLIDQAIGDKA